MVRLVQQYSQFKIKRNSTVTLKIKNYKLPKNRLVVVSKRKLNKTFKTFTY